MIILHLTLGLGNGGAEGALFRLISNDKSNKHMVISIMGDGIYGQRLRELGTEVISYNVERGSFSLAVLVRVFNVIRNSAPDVLQTWLYHCDVLGGILGKLAGVPKICWGIRHSNLSPDLNSTTTILLSKLSASLSGFIPSKIISCSHKATEVHSNIGYRIDKFITIPNGYDFNALKFSQFHRDEIRLKLGLKERFVFGMVGRWNPQKNHKNLLKAFSIIEKKYSIEVSLLLVGPEIDSSNVSLVKLINENDIDKQTFLIGPVDDISTVMSAIDVLVLPSLGEAFPNVVAEAMACSTPAIVTNVGDAAYIVGDSGWVVPSDDSEALANAMYEAYKLSLNEMDWLNIKESCYLKVTNDFSIDKMVQSFNNAWNDSFKGDS